MTTLVFIGFGLALVLVLSSASLSQLHRSKNLGHSMRASRAAESVLALATERLMKEPEFANSGTNFLTWSDDNSTAWLSFDTDQADDWSIPVSISNKEGISAIDGWDGIRLPSRAIHLVAVGESGGRRKTIDVVLSVPEFPFALASSGPIESEGGLLVGGFQGDDVSALDLSALGPADLYSNEAAEAVKLEGEVSVTGDVRAVGSVSLGPDAQVHGVVEQGADPITLAQIDVTDLRPNYSNPLVPGPGHTKIQGPVHYNDPDLHLSHGVELDNGILYVNGDLTISGGLTGQGALLVNGSVEIDGGAVLSAENQLAIVAEGDVVIHGAGDSSLFQGLIYTEGDLIAEDITLLGAFVANRDSSVDPGSRLKLTNANVVYQDQATNLEFPNEEFGWLYGNASTGDGTLYVMSLSGEHFYTLRDLLGTPQPGQAEWEDALTAVVDASEVKQTPCVNWLPVDPDRANWPVVDPATVRGILPSHLGGGGFTAYHNGGGTPKKRRVRYGQDNIGYSFDLNEFLSPENRTRITHWRER